MLFHWHLLTSYQSTLSPHLPVLLLQTSSALSHIFPDIRLDACKLVHVLIQHLPSYVVAAWPRGGSNILEGLRLAVGLGEEKGSSRLSAGSKLVLLRTMLAFILAALKLSGETEQGTFSGWRAMETKGKGKQRMVGVENVEEMREEGFVAAIRDWGMAEDKAAEWEIGRMGVDSNGDEGSSSDVLAVRPPIFMRADASQHLYLQLQPLLLSTFLESAPTAFSPSSTSTSASSTNTEDIPLGLCSVTASLTEALAHPTLSASSAATPTEEVHAGVSDFLRRMAPYFPIRALKPASTPNGLSPAFALSLSYANLTVLLAPRPPVLVFPRGVRREVGWRGRVRAVEEAWTIMRTQRRKVTGKGKVGGADAWALEEVAEWVVEILVSLYLHGAG